MTINVHSEVMLLDGNNHYAVIQSYEDHVQLECVYFGGREDLGCDVFCEVDAGNQRIKILKSKGNLP